MMPAVPRADLRSLQPSHELGSGGQGQVTAVSGVLVNGRWPAALKTYAPDVARSVDAAALEQVIRFREALAPGERDWLDEHTAWPTTIVEEHGTVRGFLMRALPPEYYFSYHTQSQRTQQKHADIAFLLNSDQYVNRAGLVVTDQDRIALLKDLAVLLARLHSLGVTVGDFSPKNVLFRLSPAPACFLIDCDAMQVRGASVTGQIQTPDWEVPAGEPTATPAADAYKFALLAIRIFARDQSSFDVARLGEASPDLGRLAHSSLYDGPRRRPAVADWIPALEAAATMVSLRKAYQPTISVPIGPVGEPVRPRSPYVPAGPVPAPRRRNGGAKVAGTVAAALVAAGLAVVGVHAAGSHPAVSATQAGSDGAAGDSSSGSLASTGSPGSPGSGSSAPSTEQAAAQHLANLLSQSAGNRSSIVNAVSDVSTCGPDLSQDSQVFQDAADSRQTLLNDLTNISGLSALPAQMTRALSNAWQASKQADQDFAAWAQDENSSGCTPNDTSDSNYQAASGPDTQASQYKQQFTDQWNQIASQYGLDTYQPGQL